MNLPRDPSRVPLVALTFNLDIKRDELRIPHAELEVTTPHKLYDFFDLRTNLTDSVDGLQIDCTFSTDLFEEQTIERWLGHWHTLLNSIMQQPAQPVGKLPMLTSSERQRALEGWNDTDRDYPREVCVHRLFEAQVEKHPDSVAVVMGDRSLTYAELNRRSNRLARHLQSRNAGPGSAVAICLDRSLETIVTILAILKAGATYVRLDPVYPQERIAFMLRDSGAHLVVTSSFRSRDWSIAGIEAVCLDHDRDRLQNQDAENLSTSVSAGTAAYIMYTSGSSGTPKGIAIPHRGVVRLVCGTSYIEFGPTLTTLQHFPTSFDVSTFEIWGPLLHGGTCVLFPEQTPTPATIARAIKEHAVNTLVLTASFFNIIVDEAPQTFAPLRDLLVGGETLSVSHVERALALLPSTHP